MNLNFLSTFLRCFFIFSLIFIASLSSQAQRGSPSAMSAKAKRESTNYRILANYDLVMTSPGDLNSQRSTFLWNGTTPTLGTFGNMNGFTVGAGYLAGSGFLGLEYSSAVQELSNTLIPPGTTSVQDTLNYDVAYVVYDWLFNKAPNQSYEFGLGLGQTLKFQFHNIFTSSGVTEDLIWQATPMVFKVRANYNYHFSSSFKLRVGATYENATSSSLTASANHPTINIAGSPVVSGQPLRNNAGQNVKVDISGFRINAGLVLAF
ncbi:MAG: hypothetical protein AABY53_09125 [Bdellovibrionota bacterium]